MRLATMFLGRGAISWNEVGSLLSAGETQGSDGALQNIRPGPQVGYEAWSREGGGCVGVVLVAVIVLCWWRRWSCGVSRQAQPRRGGMLV